MASTHAAVPAVTGKSEIRIVSHSNLFYWWPVWAVGFIMAALTAFENTLLATVPKHTELLHQASGTIDYYEPSTGPDHQAKHVTGYDLAKQDVLVAPKASKRGIAHTPHLQISAHKNYGVLFATVLLLVICITNIPLRGLWSVIVIVIIVSLVIILALMGAWEHILTYVSLLDIRITMGGYVLISAVLFCIWLAILLFFDQQIYMVFTPGQFRVRLAIGEGETAYDTSGMTLQKERSDLFRHWILGLGSGDLVVQTAGAQVHRFDLHNVLFVGRKLREIEEMLRSRQVVAGRID